MNTTHTSRLAGMLNKRLFVVMRELRDASKVGSLLEAHLDWMVEVERKGQLFASGPFVAKGLAPGMAGGMTILRASSVAEARAIVSEDPFIKDQVYSIEVKEWSLMEGSVTVNLRFSDQTGSLL